MSTRSEKERSKQIQDKCQNLLTQMLRDEDNKYCVDCDAKGPRWASWNLGIFLCIRCAGIHRNLGVHISKVKSVNLDSWTPEQVVSLQQMGNSRARAVYEANLPDSFRRPQTDCSLESFIRAKYEHKKYIAREWVPPTIPKVNWDKELEEEAEKQRRKKTSSVTSSQTVLPPSVKKLEVVPQLPKPRSSVSPKPNRIIAPVTTNSNSLDLLGLDVPESQSSANGSSGDDIFSSFLSAPPSSSASSVNGGSTNTSSSSATNPAGKTEEENFFNQPMPSTQEKNKMTKDSIMALYGTSSQKPSFPATSGGMYSQLAQPFTAQPNAPFVQQNAFMVQPSMGQLGSMAAPMVMPVGNQMQANPNPMCMHANPMGSIIQPNGSGNGIQSMAQINGLTSATTMNVPMMQMGQSNNGWSGMMLNQNLQPAPGSNPFFNLPPTQQLNNAFSSQLPQQMSQMSLNGMGFSSSTAAKPASASVPGQTLSTNLWQ